MRLSPAQRERLPDSAFAVINKRARTEKERRKYPVPDAPHARNALARVSRFGTSREKMLVCRKVQMRFPQIHATKCPTHRLSA